MFEQENATAATACMHGAEETSGAGPHNNDVITGAGVMVRYGRGVRPRLPKNIPRQKLLSPSILLNCANHWMGRGFRDAAYGRLVGVRLRAGRGSVAGPDLGRRAGF